jgi:hypothetical protein
MEQALRAGADHYPSARADLADLLRSTGRIAETRAVLERGAKLGEQECWLPLGNLYADADLLRHQPVRFLQRHSWRDRFTFRDGRWPKTRILHLTWSNYSPQVPRRRDMGTMVARNLGTTGRVTFGPIIARPAATTTEAESAVSRRPDEVR